MQVCAYVWGGGLQASLLLLVSAPGGAAGRAQQCRGSRQGEAHRAEQRNCLGPHQVLPARYVLPFRYVLPAAM